MAVKEFSKSMKAKMYDFTYTPFMSSMVIAWIILNHKYILIYMSSATLDEKLNHFKVYDFSLWDLPYMYNIILPILFGLFYTFIYPKISKYFYQYTLNRTRELKTIKKDIEDKTPITEEEAREYREQFILMSAEIQELRAQLSDANKMVLKKNTDKNLTKEELQQMFPKSTPEKETKSSTEEDDKSKILRYFYESNYKPVSPGTLLDKIVNTKKIARPKVEKIINHLLSDKIIEKKYDKYNNSSIHITNSGKDILLSLFDKELILS